MHTAGFLERQLSAERSSVREMMQHPFITSNSTSSKEQQPTGSMSRSPAPPHLLDMHRSRSQGDTERLSSLPHMALHTMNEPFCPPVSLALAFLLFMS